jgi:hypothetical protein
MFKTLRVFAPSSSEFIPFLACHHSITDFEISAFLNQGSYRLLKFVLDLVSIFDTGLSRPIVGSDKSCDRAVKLVGS